MNYHTTNFLNVDLTTFSAKHSKITFSGFYGSSIGLTIANLVQQANKNVILLVTPDLHAVERLFHEIKFFLWQQENLSRNAVNHIANKQDNFYDLDFPLLTFPDWETLPYDHFSPHQDIISQRLLTLYKLPQLTKGIIIIAINTLMIRLPPLEHVLHNSFVLKIHDKLDLTSFRRRLEQQGYHCVNKVFEHGEFAVRGSLLDIFPMGSRHPFRIDLFGDNVDSIRIFDPDTQLTVSKVDSINLLPAKEYPINNEAINDFRQKWRETFAGNVTQCAIYNSVSNGESPHGIEYYLPLFFQQMSSLLSYLPKKTVLISVDDIYQQADNFWHEIKKRYDVLQHDLNRPVLAPTQVFFTVDELFGYLKEFSQLQLLTANIQNINAQVTTCEYFSALPEVTVNYKLHKPLHNLQNFLQHFILKKPSSNLSKVLFCVNSKGRLETIKDLLHTINVQTVICQSWHEFIANNAEVSIAVADLDQGFVIQHNNNFDYINIAIITENDLFGNNIRQERQQRKQHKYLDPENIIRDLTELQIGSPVVHVDHGIGNYLGLQTITTDNITTEYLTIAYANDAKLYVPIASLHLISRYTGVDSEHVSYNILGTDKWRKIKDKVLHKIRDVASELLALYAKRTAKVGLSIACPTEEYVKFANTFPFTPTIDQQQAIDAVIADLVLPTHMDRLVCGDVGFGKTEVAMRATFISAFQGFQVAVLAPTTILAQQHFLNFKDRFADWAFNIELLSRFRTATEQKHILEKLKHGKIDIIVGTHALIQEKVQFSNLGLLIIDEEHRFGVKQKERIKALRPDVNLLTLTATPIPRTLNMALTGMRDFSIIASPPARRLAIKTFLYNRNDEIIREAIWREILRGGQVYFLHNDVATIEKTARELKELIPSIKVTVAHGQMREKELEHIMQDFYHGRFNVLVCTTIIESGIDVPSANTVIIDRADRLGLAQLHQIRGRVGRSHHQAYAYLLVPDQRILSDDASRRLEAITSIETLGAGFNLATHDLEIRGAGELLGAEQSGHIEGIGFSLYMEYLEEAVKNLKEGKDFSLHALEKTHVTVEIKIPALFPDEYIVDVNTRLTLYKRLANAKDFAEIYVLQEEIIDRFGNLPEASKNLIRITKIKILAEELGINKINANQYSGYLEFSEQPKINPTKLIALIQQQSQTYKLQGKYKLAFNVPKNHQTNAIVLLDFIENLLNEKLS